jgi:hypothetical protein
LRKEIVLDSDSSFATTLVGIGLSDEVLVGGKVTQHVLVHTVEKNLSVFDVEHELMPNYESQRLR